MRVERAPVLEPARQHQAGDLARLDELAGGIAHPHQQRDAVAVDVAGHPARVLPRRAGGRAASSARSGRS